jgi:hypothetical protein
VRLEPLARAHIAGIVAAEWPEVKEHLRARLTRA